MDNKILLGVNAAIVIVAIVFVSQATAGSNADFDKLKSEKFVQFKSTSCGCCDVYGGYLKGKQMSVEVNNVADVGPTKRKYGVPSSLESCHTTIVGNYFVEGHIPIEAVEKLFKEKPDIAGIAMPGMPMGSPGMPGGKTEAFVIYSVGKDGSIREFTRI